MPADTGCVDLAASHAVWLWLPNKSRAKAASSSSGDGVGSTLNEVAAVGRGRESEGQSCQGNAKRSRTGGYLGSGRVRLGSLIPRLGGI